MTLASRIAKNAGFMMVGSVGSKLILFVLNVYVARRLGAEAFGAISFALAFTAIFAVFSHLGLNTLTTREVARDKAQAGRYLANVLSMEIVLSLVTFALIVLFINVLDYQQGTRIVVYIIGIAVIVENTFSTTCKAVFRAYERMEFDALVSIAGRLLLGIGGATIITLGHGILELAYFYLLSSLVTLLLGLAIVARRFAAIRLAFEPAFCRTLVRTAIPFGIAGVFNLIFLKTDVVMLSIFKGDAVVGWYSASMNLILALALLNNAFLYSIGPSMAIFHQSSKEALMTLYENSLKFALVLIIPVAIGTVLLADPLITLLYGPAYQNSVIALQVLIWSGVLSFANGVFYALFGSIDRQKTSAYIMGGGAVANVVLNLALIPPYGLVGASVATVATQAVCFAASFYFLKAGYFVSLPKLLVKPTIASLLMGAVIFYLDGLHVLLLVLLGIVLYFVVLFGIGGISRSDRAALHQLIRRER